MIKKAFQIWPNMTRNTASAITKNLQNNNGTYKNFIPFQNVLKPKMIKKLSKYGQI